MPLKLPNKGKDKIDLLSLIRELKELLLSIITISQIIITPLVLVFTPEKNRILFYAIFQLLLFIIVCIYLSYKYYYYIPQKVRIFIPYVQKLADLSHVDLQDYTEMHKWYVPLKAREFYSSPVKSEIEGSMREIQESIFLPSLDEYFEKWKIRDKRSNGLILTGTTGSGKSTTLKHIAHQWAKDWLKDKSQSLPIFIPLRMWFSSLRGEGEQLTRMGFSDYFREENGIKEFDWSAFKNQIVLGEVVLILDGFDEILIEADLRIIKNYANSITDLLTSQSKIVITTRFEAFSSWGDFSNIFPLTTEKFTNLYSGIRFQPLEIQPLDEKLIKEMIRKRVQNDPKIEDACEISEYLLNYENLQKILECPLFLRFIFDLYIEQKGTKEREELLGLLSRELTEYELFSFYTLNWLSREDKKPSTYTTKEERLPLIKALSWIALENGQIISSSFIEEVIEKNFPNKSEEENIKIKQDLRKSSFLEHFENINSYQFHYKSIAEFFVMQDIQTCDKSNKNKLIERFWGLDLASQFGTVTFLSKESAEAILTSKRPYKEDKIGNGRVWLRIWSELFNFDEKATKELPKEIQEIGLVSLQ